MLYGCGNEQAGRKSAWHERLALWTRWVESHPDKAAAWALTMEDGSTARHSSEVSAFIMCTLVAHECIHCSSRFVASTSSAKTLLYSALCSILHQQSWLECCKS